MDRVSWHCTGSSDQDHSQGKEMQKGKMVVWGGLTNSWVKKRSKRQRRKWKIHPSESVSSGPQLCLTLCRPMDCSMPGFAVLHHLPELAQTHVHWVSDAIQPSRPLSFPSPAFNLSQHQGLFQWVSSSHQVAKVSISPSNEYSRLILFRIDWSDLLSVQGALKGLFQLHSLKASILWHSAFLMVYLSHLYMTTGRSIALTR